ncbi:MAG TPA: DASS family sodium-coupled anion symporter [Gemmatimonadales bacterium]|nr:DASS family sodium-coupled anion symporter [Gemmatimonadales bacterium]
MLAATSDPSPKALDRRARAVRWAIVLGVGLAIALAPRPDGITADSWRLLAIFVATVLGLTVGPLPGGAMVLLGVGATAMLGILPVAEALAGYGDPIVWLVLAAFFMSRGMIKTGLGRRIAFVFIRAIGKRSLGLGYALALTDCLLASFIPSNGARSGGIVFPIAKSLAEAYDSRPGPSAARLGTFLMNVIYQCGVVSCAMYLTGQASNALIASFAMQTARFELTYGRWLLGAIVPGLIGLFVAGLIVYRLSPPEVKHTPRAAALAREELERMGPMSHSEKLMMLVFGLVAVLWMTTALHKIHYAAIALLGICVLLLSGVLDWEDVKSERGGWDVFIWYGGLVRLAGALAETGITDRFAQATAGYTQGWAWGSALLGLLLVYFYAHYGFASITAHATAMYTPFLAVMLAAGAPAGIAVLSLAYCSNLMAGLTHYGTTPGPIYFGAGYVSQATWWRIGLVGSFASLAIWLTVGVAWWKVLGYW